MIPASFDPIFTLVVEPATITAHAIDLADRLRTLIEPYPYDEPYEEPDEIPVRALWEFLESSALSSLSRQLYSAARLAVLAAPNSFAGDPLVVAWQRGSGVCVVNLSARFVTVRSAWGAVREFSVPAVASGEATLLQPYSTVWLTR
ncbi:Hypothetical protein AJAP_11995 [Amycolatopsis japonica]|uniref:DUF3459 domain-containing protein n=1 Tax=Amycolatopsis japonica TaxID=208439 RepID=A0A075UMD4_9PSEU|nr:hypothetical protein [Amycolatopsis japonica]AIG75282.1 Hypothetical protein AJAP_11995 [Amycolatopsis japonica]